MSTSESFDALHRANPRNSPYHAASVESVADSLRSELVTTREDARPRRRLLGVTAATTVTAAAGAAAFLIIGSPGGGPGIENARAAVKRAATKSAAFAERSGTATVRMTNDGAFWAATTVRWHGDDVSVARADGMQMLVVGGTLYGFDPMDGGWIDFGSPSSIDPDSGTTPAEYLAAAREDVGGTTLRRFTRAIAGLSTTRRADGSTVYSGKLPAGVVARETGFKEGQSIRVLPFGYVAHDAADDPRNLLDVAITVSADGTVREVAVTWPGWTYTVSYSGLGETPVLVAPANARSLLKERSVPR